MDNIPVIVNYATIALFVLVLVVHLIMGMRRGIFLSILRLPFYALSFGVAYLASKVITPYVIEWLVPQINQLLSQFMGNAMQVDGVATYLITVIMSLATLFIFFTVDKLLVVLYGLVKRAVLGPRGDRKKIKFVSRILGGVLSLATGAVLFQVYAAPIVCTVSSLTPVVQTVEENVSEVNYSKLLKECDEGISWQYIHKLGGEWWTATLTNRDYTYQVDGEDKTTTMNVMQFSEWLNKSIKAVFSLQSYMENVQSGDYSLGNMDAMRDVLDNLDSASVDLFSDILISNVGEANKTELQVVTDAIANVVENRESNPEAYEKDVKAIHALVGAAENANDMTVDDVQETVDAVLQSTAIMDALRDNKETVGDVVSNVDKEVVKEQLQNYKNNESYSAEDIALLAEIFGVTLTEE